MKESHAIQLIEEAAPMTITRKNAQAYFSSILSLFWLIFGLMLGVISVYLQAHGFTNTQIGLILGTINLLSTVLQPSLATIFDRTGRPLRRCLAVSYGVLLLLSASLLLLPLPRPLLLVNIVALFALKSSLQPNVNALVQTFEHAGFPVNFGAARGMGSLTYGIIIAIAGAALERISPLLLPASYIGLLALFILLLTIPKMDDSAPINRTRRVQTDRAGLSSPAFILFLIASTCFSLNAVMNGSFMLQIMQGLGGGSTEYGLATSIPAILEFPAMLLFSRFSRRFGNERLLVFAGWAWFAKNGLILLARSPEAIYAAQLLQFVSYAFFIPGVVDYIAKILPAESFLKGQSLYGSAYTIGSVIAVFFGGTLLDRFGVHTTLTMAQCFSLIGAVLLTLSVRAAGRGSIRNS